MSITIGSDYISGSTNLEFQPNGGGTVMNYLTNGIRQSTSVPAFTAAGTVAWTYRDQVGGSDVEWGSTLGWTSSQQGAGSYGFDNTNGRYYAPVTGRYYFTASTYAHCDTNTSNCYFHFMFALNGARNYNSGKNPYNIYMHGTNNNYPDGCMTTVSMQLSAGQYMCLKVPWASNNSRIYGNHTMFGGCLIG